MAIQTERLVSPVRYPAQLTGQVNQSPQPATLTRPTYKERILFIGENNCGKSTLARELLSSGYRYVVLDVKGDFPLYDQPRGSTDVSARSAGTAGALPFSSQSGGAAGATSSDTDGQLWLSPESPELVVTDPLDP